MWCVAASKEICPSQSSCIIIKIESDTFYEGAEESEVYYQEKSNIKQKIQS